MLALLAQHGYLIVFAWIAAEQLGAPIPGIPLLLATGAVAGEGRLGLGAVVLVATAASLLGDSVWYVLGRRKGARMLRFLCRISLEPDTCVRRTEQIFERHGAGSLILAKFVPGLATVAPPLAGVSGMPWSLFLATSATAGALYTGAYACLGYLFSAQIERLVEHSLRFGRGMTLVLAGALAAYVLFKYGQRQRILRRLRVARITPEELKGRFDRGEDVFIVDLRHATDVEVDPQQIPGAVYLSPDDLDARHSEIPRDREIILYCT
ncbi:MAG TPA: VTT domain-containing protein [Candidatus Polarisedimenticolia bacterium]|jgi:membrane protein DedA with SNARE-associated domain|nr:VTT domain-containing protein [Candidatus Polarisedimenticolia bacterium]